MKMKQGSAACPEAFISGSGTAKGYLSTRLDNPEIECSVRGETSSAIAATISCSVAGVVT